MKFTIGQATIEILKPNELHKTFFVNMAMPFGKEWFLIALNYAPDEKVQFRLGLKITSDKDAT